MKCAVLCNGPSRKDYIPSSEYGFVIGCNIPWTTVDCTVVLDEEIIRKWAKEPNLINVPVYFSRHAWRETDGIKKRDFFIPYLIEIVDPLPEYDSSGHVAVSCMIKKGFTEIDIYGCDSWFEQTIASYTHKYVKNLNPDNSPKHVSGWRKRWKTIMEDNPQVKLNFIRK